MEQTEHQQNTPITSFYHVSTMLIILFLFLLIGMHFRHEPTNTDLWNHLVAGKAIYEQKSIPTTDIFSYTRLGQPWSMHEWLYQLFLYSAYITLGMTGLLILNTTFLLISFILFFISLKKNFILLLLLQHYYHISF